MTPVVDMEHSQTLPALLTVPEAAKVLGIGRTLAYELVRTGCWPTPVIRAGKLIKIPAGPLLDLVVGNRNS
jgi:excisionase family DNA binding protein